MGVWKEIIVGNSADILAGYAFDSKQFVDKSKGIPLIRIRDLKRGYTELNYAGNFQDRYIIRHDDVLIGMDGDFHVVRWKGIRALLNQRVLKVSAKSGLDNNLLYYFLVGELIKIQNQITGTTVKHLSNSDVAEIRIKVPNDINEQSSIARILTTIDQAIEQTEQLIAKYERIKTGLMQDLLTRGIDEQGNIRNEETHDFMDSEMGRVPKDWKVIHLGKTGELSKGSTISKSKLSYSGVDCILYGEIYTKYHYYATQCISKVPHEVVSRKTPIGYGDLLFAGSGETHEEIGKCIAYLGKNPCFAGGDIIIFRSKEFNPVYLSALLNSHPIQKQKSKLSQGSSVIHIYPKNIALLEIVKPTLAEQNKIADIIIEMDNYIAELNKILSKQHLQKSGLMQDLLTGKVRVDTLFMDAQQGTFTS